MHAKTNLRRLVQCYPAIVVFVLREITEGIDWSLV